MDRHSALEKLLAFKDTPQALANMLGQFAWDSEELLVMTHALLAHALQRYIKDELKLSDIESWANLIEGRDDIGYESETVKETIHALANPDLSVPLSPSEAGRLISLL